jgi:Na+-driven multidrug efflux pump
MKSLLTIALTVCVAGPAAAYVGPGPGLSLLGALWALLATLLTAVAFIVLWPLRRRRRRKAAAAAAAAARHESDSEDVERDVARGAMHRTDGD